MKGGNVKTKAKLCGCLGLITWDLIGNQSYVTDGKLLLCLAAITAKAERKRYDFNTSNHGWNGAGFRLSVDGPNRSSRSIAE